MIQHLAVVGATGAVGREVCTLLGRYSHRVQRVSLLASKRGAGTRIPLGETVVEVRELTGQSFKGVDFVICCAGGEVSRQFAPIAVGEGAVVIDNSSVFRMEADVPLVIPEINPDDARRHRGIVANPNCSTIIMNVAVWPLHQANPLIRIVVDTYQAASGAGASAMEELRVQTADVLEGRQARPRVFRHPIAFNLFSHDTPIGPDGYNTEERKMIDETRKIFHQPSLAVTATCVRVPVLRAHSEAIHLTFERPMSPDSVREILRKAPGVELVDDVRGGRFPMPVDATGRDPVLVGRIRQDASQPDGRGIVLFVCGDQLRKGAALNALQILECLMD